MLNTVKAMLWIALLISAQTQSASIPLRIDANAEEVETVFSWRNDRCFDENIPDSPARAFRSKGGVVYLYATHHKNVPLTGASLDNLKPACATQFQGANSADPRHYNTRIWLQTFFSTNSGKDIYSLGSSDYHGKWFKNCKLTKNPSSDCWFSAIVLAHSIDGGKTFTTATPPDHVVANSSQQYSPTQEGSVGFLTTSNIVKVDDYFYALFYASADKRQRNGNCLARTNDLADARSWRAWDGRDFNVSLYQPQKLKGSSATCKTLPSLPYKIRSLLWHEASQGYIATFEKTKSIKTLQRRTDVTFSYSWSKDLKDWSRPREIVTLEGPLHCSRAQVAGAYPSLVDSSSLDENFGSVGDSAYLYYTKFNLQSKCRLTLDRDLVRIPIKIHSE